MSEIVKRTALAAAQRRNETIEDPEGLSRRIAKAGVLDELVSLLGDDDLDVLLSVARRLARAREG